MPRNLEEVESELKKKDVKPPLAPFALAKLNAIDNAVSGRENPGIDPVTGRFTSWETFRAYLDSDYEAQKNIEEQFEVKSVRKATEIIKVTETRDIAKVIKYKPDDTLKRIENQIRVINNKLTKLDVRLRVVEMQVTEHGFEDHQ